MNYFAHAMPFLDRPHFLVGTGVPDWLTVADRQVRLRMQNAEAALEDGDPFVAEVAAGVLQHLHDDARFHASRAFAETSLTLTAWVRDVLGDDSSMRLAFLGHLLVELLLDGVLAAENPDRLAEYYRILDEVDPHRIEAAVNRIAPRHTQRLGVFVGHFLRERILWDYLEDDRLLVRLNQIMRRVRLDPLPNKFGDLLPAARKLVIERKEALLADSGHQPSAAGR